MLIKKDIFWPKKAKTGNITLGEFSIRKNWCGQFWWFWIFNSTFWLAWQAIIFSTSMLFQTFSRVSSSYFHKWTNYAYEHQIQNCSPWKLGSFGFLQKYESYCFMLKTEKMPKKLKFGKSWLHPESFFTCPFVNANHCPTYF